MHSAEAISNNLYPPRIDQQIPTHLDSQLIPDSNVRPKLILCLLHLTIKIYHWTPKFFRDILRLAYLISLHLRWTRMNSVGCFMTFKFNDRTLQAHSILLHPRVGRTTSHVKLVGSEQCYLLKH